MAFLLAFLIQIIVDAIGGGVFLFYVLFCLGHCLHVKAAERDLPFGFGHPAKIKQSFKMTQKDKMGIIKGQTRLIRIFRFEIRGGVPCSGGGGILSVGNSGASQKSNL